MCVYTYTYSKCIHIILFNNSELIYNCIVVWLFISSDRFERIDSAYKVKVRTYSTEVYLMRAYHRTGVMDLRFIERNFVINI